MIHWQLIADEYNDRYGTDFDIRDMLADAYGRCGGYSAASELLGVSATTLYTKLKGLRVPMNLRGGWNPELTTKLKILAIPENLRLKMNGRQIARYIGKSPSWTHLTLEKLGIPYAKGNHYGGRVG